MKCATSPSIPTVTTTATYFFPALPCNSRMAALALRLPPSLGPFGLSSFFAPPALLLVALDLGAPRRRCRLETASRNSRRNCSAMRSSAA